MDLLEEREYSVVVEYSSISTFPERRIGDMGGGALRLGAWQVRDPAIVLAEAVRTASEADTVILCIGSDGERESEGFDRSSMK